MKVFRIIFWGRHITVRKKAKIWNQYNQVPHLTQDTVWKSDKKHKKTSQTRGPWGQAFPNRWPQGCKKQTLQHGSSYTKSIDVDVGTDSSPTSYPSMYVWIVFLLICNITIILWAGLIIFSPVTTFVICSCSYVAYIANYMGPDQTAYMGTIWSWFIVFASRIKSSLKCTWIYSADVKSKQYFQDKNTFAG